MCVQAPVTATTCNWGTGYVTYDTFSASLINFWVNYTSTVLSFNGNLQNLPILNQIFNWYGAFGGNYNNVNNGYTSSLLYTIATGGFSSTPQTGVYEMAFFGAPLSFFPNLYGIQLQTFPNRGALGSQYYSQGSTSPMFGGISSGTIQWQNPIYWNGNNTNLFTNDSLGIRSYQSSLLSNIYTLMYSSLAQTTALLNECFPCYFNCSVCAPGFFLNPSNSTCLTQCPYGATVSIQNSSGQVWSVPANDVNSVSNFLAAQNVSASNWTNYKFVCQPTSNMVASQNVMNFTLSIGNGLSILDKIHYQASNFNSFSWTVTSGNTNTNGLFYPYLISGFSSIVDTSLNIPANIFTQVPAGNYTFTITYISGSSTLSLSFTVFLLPTFITQGFVSFNQYSGLEYATQFTIKLSNFSLNGTNQKLSYQVYAYPVNGACAFAGSTNALNSTSCNITGFNSNYNATNAYSALNKFAYAPFNNIALPLASGMITANQSTTISNLVIYDPRLPLSSVVNYIFEVIVYSPLAPQFYIDNTYTISITTLSNASIANTIGSRYWFNVSAPTQFNSLAQSFVTQYNGTNSTTALTLVLNTNLTVINTNGPASASLGYASIATASILSNPTVSYFYGVYKSCTPNYCNFNGNCTSSNGTGLNTCTCFAGFYGSTCQWNITSYYVTQSQVSNSLYQLSNIVYSSMSNPAASANAFNSLTSVGFADVYDDYMLNLSSNISASLGSSNNAIMTSAYYASVLNAQSNLLGIAALSANASVYGKANAFQTVVSSLSSVSTQLSAVTLNGTGVTFNTPFISSTVQSFNSTLPQGTPVRLLQTSTPTNAPQPGVVYPQWIYNTFQGQNVVGMISGYVANPYAFAYNNVYNNSYIVSQVVNISLFNQNNLASITTIPSSSGGIMVYVPKLLSTSYLPLLTNVTQFFCLQWNATGNYWYALPNSYQTNNLTHFACEVQNLGTYAVQLNVLAYNNITTPNNSGGGGGTPNGNNASRLSGLTWLMMMILATLGLILV
jgi:hypothetical protein